MARAGTGGRRRLPVGTVTFLMTDVEGSTLRWDSDPPLMAEVMRRHDALIADAVAAEHGIVVESGREGDSVLAVFTSARAALTAADSIRRRFVAAAWPPGFSPRVRMAVHSGEAELRAGHYYGRAVYRCARLLALAHGGQLLLSSTTKTLAERPPDGADFRDHGMHRLKDLAVPEHVFELVDADAPETFPPLRSLDARRTNLPAPISSFVGRAHDRAEIRRLLLGARLITLTGIGGAGKSRLAVEAATEQSAEFPDGTWLVQLAPVTRADLIVSSVAAVLGVRESPGRTLFDAVADHCASHRQLFVIDNCEHLMPELAGVVAALLSRSPLTRVIATSREPLRVEGEVVWRVDPLPEPEAVQLFVERARAADRSFAPAAAAADAIADVCRRLDGIPLAIELAAGRASSLTLDEIRRRVDERFQLLVGGGPTARQQTMRAAIDWSHDQLVAPERALFRRLSVFVGSFSVDAVDAVCAFGDLEPQTVFDLLARLTGKSLVSRSDGRHRLLETIRDYARERLHEAGEADAVDGRQAAFFRDLTALPAPGAMADWLAALDADRDNLRAAFTWYLDTDPATAAAMARRCYDFWYLRGYTTEARQVLDALLGRLPAGADGRAAVECDAGRFAYVQGDQSAAQAHLAAARELAERTGDQATVARALRAEGVVALAAGQPADAEAAFEQSLSIWRDVADTGEEAETLHQLGLVVGGRGDVGDALALLRRSLELRRRLGREEEATMTLTFLAAVEVAMGDHATARDHIAAALAACDRLGDRRATWAIDVLGCIVASEGRNDVAVRLWSAAAGIHRGVGTAPPAIWFALLDAYRKPALAALGDTAAEVEAAGAALGFEAAMALAADAIRAPSPAT